ncbi:MAG: ABC transporter ATP-binding protein [Clostridia bacterium]|nr:ABC transporter ATP-binding protein [Clostridia bacterium]
MNDTYGIYAEKWKGKEGPFAILRFFLSEMRRFDPFLVVCFFALPVPGTLGAYLASRLPAWIVDTLAGAGSMKELFLGILLRGLVLLVCEVCADLMRDYIGEDRDFLRDYLTGRFIAHAARMDASQIDREEIREAYASSYASAQNSRGFYEGTGVMRIFTDLLVCLVFSVAIGRVSLLLLAIIVVSVGVNIGLLKAARGVHRKYHGTISAYAKGCAYLTDLTMDPVAGKDIRIYRMADLILKRFDENLKAMEACYSRIHWWYFGRNMTSAVFTLARDAVAYLYLISLLGKGSLSPATFVFLFSGISTLSFHLEYVLRRAMDWNTLEGSAAYFQRFLAVESTWRREEKLTEEEIAEMIQKGVSLTLRYVTFTYPGSEESVISHLTMTVSAGEKLALIGLNGTGKTTLVKLICALLIPDSGEILLCGHPREDFTREQYRRLLCVMFQDSDFLPVTLDENLTGQAEAMEGENAEALSRALSLAGALEVYERLPKKGKTRLGRGVYPDSVEVSGGEKQKLLFARTLYRNAPVTILDEPTSALDPLAEYAMYTNFREAVGGKTVIFISHRLASTRFCDRILLMEKGSIVEEGTHETLLESGGRYAELYEMQSRYYRERAEAERKRSYMEG